MAMTFDLDSVAGIAIGEAQGSLTAKEIAEAAQQMWQKLEGPRARILWDLRDASFDLSAKEIRGLAEFTKNHSPLGDLRMALVVSKNLEFGLVRMFEAFREAEGTQTAVFREKADALDWLSDDSAWPAAQADRPASSRERPVRYPADRQPAETGRSHCDVTGSGAPAPPDHKHHGDTVTSHATSPVFGNAVEATGDTRGWLLGHFMPGDDNPLRTGDVEVKWYTHQEGEVRDGWAPPTGVSTLNILIRGHFVLRFPEQEVPLRAEGDYVLFGPEISHSFRSVEESLVLTVRWPSRPAV